MTRRAVLAGSGVLPGLLAASGQVEFTVKFSDAPFDGAEGEVLEASFEHLGKLFRMLEKRGIDEVTFAGKMTRQQLNVNALDELSATLLPRFLEAGRGGDDALLRTVAEIFEAQGFRVIGAHEIRPDLIAKDGSLTELTPSKEHLSDGARGKDIVVRLLSEGIGQAVVVHEGLCLGIETLPGTDALLRFVRDTRTAKGGVLVKRAKLGQDLRFDMPAIGPNTISAARDAGITGIALSAGTVLLLDADAILSRAFDAGIALWSLP